MPSLKEAVVTQPRPKSICAETSSASVLDLGAMPASCVKPSGTPERSRGDAGDVQAQRAGDIEGQAAQQRLALAGVIGQRQGPGGRAGIEMETVQPLVC